jgi:hypothetical protein
VDEARVLYDTPVARVPGGAVRDDFGIGIVARILHAQRCEDVFLHESCIALSTDLLDQITEQHVSGVTVAPLLTRREIEWFIAEARHQFLRRGFEGLRLFVVGETCEAWDTGGVRQHVEDGDLVPRGRRIRHVFLHRILNFQFSPLLEQQDRCCRELFCHGSQAEFGGRGVGNVPFEVGHPVAFAEQDVPATRHQHGAHERLVGDVRLDDLVHAGQVLRAGKGRN